MYYTYIGSTANFLDLNLHITCNIVVSDVYNRTGQFNFSVNELLNWIGTSQYSCTKIL